MMIYFFFFKQKTAYEMRISDWSSDVCSSDLLARQVEGGERGGDVHVGDLGGGLVLHRGEDQRDDAFGDRGIAVGEEVEPAIVAGHRINPDARRAAAHPRRGGLERGGHRPGGAPECTSHDTTGGGEGKKRQVR